MAKRYTTDEVVAMMSAPSPNVEMLEQPASPFLDPAQINAAERELSQPPPEIPRPETIGTAITDAAGLDRPAAGTSGNMALQNYEAQEAFPIDQTPAPQRPAGGSPTLYPSAEETKPSLPKQRYTTDEVMSLYMQQSKPRYSTKDVMLKMVQPLDDPTMPRLGRDEYFKAKEIKKSLQESGDLPSNWEETKTAVGGFLLTVPDAFATALYKTDKSQGWFEIGGAGFNPALALSETWRRSPATLAYASEMARQGYAGMAEGLRVMGGPKYRVAETGEFVMDDEESAGGQLGQIDPRNIVDRYKAKGLTLRPVNDEDKKDFEYQQWNKKMDRDLQVERARTAEMPPEFAYRMLVGSAAAVSDYNTGRNDFANITGNVGPMQSQAVVGSMLVDPLTYTTFGAAATRIGISAAAKGATARSLDIIGRAVNKAVKPAEVPLTQIDRFRKIVMPPAKVAGAYGLAAGASYAADVMQLPPELKTAAYTAASLYTAYRGGLGVLRFVGKRFPEASVILRESADPTNGLDLAARKVVASNPNVPGNVRARLERPSQFLSMESTPQRLSQNMALSPGTRKMMEKLSNWYVVQGVRGASDVATGAVKGAIVAAPFAELTRLGGDERAADAMYGIGPALGALGGAANRVFGARGRTIGRAESDIGRMLVDVQAGNTELRSKIGADGKAALQSWNFYNSEIGRMLTDVELAAGDVNALVKNRSFDELARIAAMQGFFRSKVDYIPLGAADFALNAEQHGADGSAGFFLSVPDSERARIFVNVDARRADVEPHEFGEAFFSTGAFSPEQMAAMRSGVDARYGLDGVQKRANEYAESLIGASNATNFPNEKLVISAEQIQAKVNELAQAELQRGGNDPLDWVRREIMVEEWRMAGMDFASIRRNIPEGANPVKFIEDVLGANARALGLSGVRVDPETGIPITPEQLFRENPVAADDPVVMSNLKAYTKAYRAWLNDPAHEVPSGVKIAPDGRAESLANNPNVIFDANGQNPLATRDPQTGQVQWKSDRDRTKEAKVRGQQIRNVAGRDLVAPGSPQFGPKKTANGRIRISGRRLPAALELQKHWKPQLDKIRRLEALADGDESTQVLYVAMGNSADKVKTSRPQDIVAINREMVFDEWVVQGKNNDLYGQFLDLTTIRNRAMRAISERNPALDPANGGPGYSLQAVMDDVYQWMADKRANRDGAATIGADRKNVVNALINPGTNLNREKNPIAGAFGRGSAIKTLLVDNIMAVSGTGRKGAAMDYNWANGNFMPDKPAPRPNMDDDLTPSNNNRMPSALPQSGMAMPEVPVRGERADIPLNPRARQAAFISDRGEVRSTGRATHFETNEDLGPDFLAIGAGHLGEDGFFRFGSQTMDDAMGESPTTSAAAAARFNQSVYDQGRRPSAMLEEPPGLERAGGRGQTGQAMPDTDQPRRYVSMEKFIKEAGDDLDEVLANAYSDMEINEDRTGLVGFGDTRNSMYRGRVPVREFFDWLHSDEPMRGMTFEREYKPATAGEGASHTRESYQAVIDRLRKISLKPTTGRTRGQAMPDVAPTLENFDAAQQATGGTLRPIADQPENAPVSGRLTPEQSASIDELQEYYRSVTPQRVKELQADAVESLASRLINKGIPVTEANDMAKATFRTLRSRVNGAMQVISGMGPSDLSRMAGTGRPAVATRKGVNPNWLTSAFEAFDTDNDLALMKAQQVARQLNKEQQAQVAAGQSVDAARASGVRAATIDQGMQFVIGEKTADQKAFGSSLREDPSAPPRVYASVVEGQKFGSQGNYNVFFEWKKDAPMVVTSHHHYGVGNGLTDIHASANIGDKNARSFGDPQAEVYDTLPSGKKVLRTRLLVGNAGAADIRAHQLMVSIPESALSGIKKKGADGARAELNRIAISQLVGSASQGKTQSFTSKDGVAPMVAIQRNRTEAYVLNPDLKNVASITIVSNSPKETALIKKNLANAFKNNGSPLPRIKVVSAESGPSSNPGRKKITDEFFNLTGKVVYGAALGGAAALAAEESQQ